VTIFETSRLEGGPGGMALRDHGGHEFRSMVFAGDTLGAATFTTTETNLRCGERSTARCSILGRFMR
jgi:hypothetical protein